MTPEKEARIRDLAKVFAECRVTMDCLQATNRCGKTYDELIKLQQDASIAEARWWEARCVLEDAIRERPDAAEDGGKK